MDRPLLLASRCIHLMVVSMRQIPFTQGIEDKKPEKEIRRKKEVRVLGIEGNIIT